MHSKENHSRSFFLVALERAFRSVEAVEVKGVSSCLCNSRYVSVYKTASLGHRHKAFDSFLRDKVFGNVFLQLLCLKLD